MSHRLRAFALILLLIVLGVGGLVAVRRARHPVRMSGGPELLVFDVPGEIEEAPQPFSPFSLRSLRRERPTLLEYTEAIREAASDDAVRAMVLHLDGTSWGWARLAELRSALRTFEAAGKPVFASLNGGDNGDYLLASVAGRVTMPPTTTLELTGLSATAMFFKGSLDKLDIHANYAHVGQFKSAVEQYTRTDMSPSAKQAMDTLLDDTYGVLVDSLASARRVLPDSMRRLIDDGPFTAREARLAGLVDTLLDREDTDSLAARDRGRTLRAVPLDRYLDRTNGGPPGTEMALVVASGAIVPGRSHDDVFNGSQCGSETIVTALREAGRRRSVKAVILRVDSPGGSGEASDDIWQEVRRVRRLKPVIVSMGNYAASGGYYIACGADAIVAEPATITGSIGVFGGKLNMLGLYRKLGLSVETLTRGRHADMFSPFRDFTPEESQRFQHHLDDFYQTFLGRVALGRHLDVAAVDSIGQGHVWSGLSARRLGLVDSLGGMNEAVALARVRARLKADTEIDLEVYPRPNHPLLRHLVGDMFDEDDHDDARLRDLLSAFGPWLAASRIPARDALAILPYVIQLH